ncbi:lysozyme inhibitor LprI family protein [Thioclava sp. GXIMD4216]|uniref:lysozyme inhibitor LprI family protein n=1 Tax=Thioclava sp. GXIMD4216 TaxID=3131929 RepID=UPI0030D51EA8
MKLSSSWLMMTALLALPLMGPVAAHADVDEDCASAKTQAEMNQCYDKALTEAEAKLQAAYTKALENNNAEEPGLAAMLEVAEPGWLAYRDQQCALENYYSRGGSGYGVFVASCRIKMTEARTAFLTDMVEAP